MRWPLITRLNHAWAQRGDMSGTRSQPGTGLRRLQHEAKRCWLAI
ncbi:hypothetical protein [Streptomyces sp. NPDC002221]